jgi:hypothetical protein
VLANLSASCEGNLTVAKSILETHATPSALWIHDVLRSQPIKELPFHSLVGLSRITHAHYTCTYAIHIQISSSQVSDITIRSPIRSTINNPSILPYASILSDYPIMDILKQFAAPPSPRTASSPGLVANEWDYIHHTFHLEPDRFTYLNMFDIPLSLLRKLMCKFSRSTASLLCNMAKVAGLISDLAGYCLVSQRRRST